MPKISTNDTERRSFIKTLAAATGTLLSGSTLAAIPEKNRILLELRLKQEYALNDQIQVGAIGFGGRGLYNVEQSLAIPGVKMIAACDIYDGRLNRAKEIHGAGIQTSRAYEDLLSNPAIDAIIIAGPHHHNAQISKDALKAGKAVYCEKPMVLKLPEGAEVIAAESKAKKPFMVGSQRVSSIIYEKARQLIAEGAIGELNYVEAWWDRNSAIGAWQYSIPPDASLKTVDWNKFIGNAPKIAYDEDRFFRWRNYKDYSAGVAGDLFVHLFSGLHYITGTKGPSRVAAMGGLRYWKDGRDIPDVLLGMYDYAATATTPAFNLVLRTNFIDGSGGSTGFRFVGSEGVLLLDNSIIIKKNKRGNPGYNIESFTKATQAEYIKAYKAKYPDLKKEMQANSAYEYKAPERYNDMYDHLTVFYDAVRNGTKVKEDATFGFRAAAPAIITNDAYFTKQQFSWQPDQMVVTSNK